MKCPHCSITIHEGWQGISGGLKSPDAVWAIEWLVCPECGGAVFKLKTLSVHHGREGVDRIVFPKATGRPPLPSEVPAEFASDYNEAALVLGDSPKASAALSRRCLQSVLVHNGSAQGKTLHAQIEHVAPSLPSYIGNSLHQLRTIGNFAAHPEKDSNTGAIIDVEVGEAEWLLDLLDSVFDHYFVKPAREQAMKDALNQKLQSAGKPPIL